MWKTIASREDSSSSPQPKRKIPELSPWQAKVEPVLGVRQMRLSPVIGGASKPQPLSRMKDSLNEGRGGLFTRRNSHPGRKKRMLKRSSEGENWSRPVITAQGPEKGEEKACVLGCCDLQGR